AHVSGADFGHERSAFSMSFTVRCSRPSSRNSFTWARRPAATSHGSGGGVIDTLAVGFAASIFGDEPEHASGTTSDTTSRSHMRKEKAGDERCIEHDSTRGRTN